MSQCNNSPTILTKMVVGFTTIYAISAYHH